jgi:hypothetical protein
MPSRPSTKPLTANARGHVDPIRRIGGASPRISKADLHVERSLLPAQ